MDACSLARLKSLAGTLLLALAAPAVVGESSSSIRGSPHDFSTRGWGSDQICIFCHTPHNAAVNVAVPLWNHPVTAQTFTLYSGANSSTFNATTSQPEGVSKLCLSCHDGTVAIDSFGSRSGAIRMGNTRRYLGVDLRNNHPVSFTFDSTLVTADAHGGPAQLVVPVSAQEVVPDVPLFQGKVECATCHNPHNNTYGNFLRVSNSASALCLRCHIK